MRTQWIDAEREVRRLELGYLDVSDMLQLSQKFSTACILKKNNEKDMLRLFEAKSYLEGCVTRLKSLIDPIENELIKKVNQNYQVHDVLESYFDNFLSSLDAEVGILKKDIALTKDEIKVTEYLVRVAIKSFREKLVESMYNLILFPILKSLIVFKEFKIIHKAEIKDGIFKDLPLRTLFEYILFREVFISARIKGTAMRQKVSMSAGSQQLNIHETNIQRAGRAKQADSLTERYTNVPPEVDDLKDIFEDLEDEEESEEEEGNELDY